MSETKKKLKPATVGVSVASGASVTSVFRYSRSNTSQTKFTREMLDELAVINRLFPNSGQPGTTLFSHLQDVEYWEHPKGHHELYEGYNPNTYIAKLASALASGGKLLDSWIGKDTGELYKVFRQMQSYASPQRLPVNYMTYALNRMGQTSLPGGKMGWEHLKEFRV